MAAAHTHVIEVSDFEREVIAPSATVPVLVDFWAHWCGPCRVLGPVLESLATEFRGAFILAKVNVDENQAVATHYQIRSIPDVKLFMHGKVVDQFVGALPAERIRAFLRKHCPSDAERLVAQGNVLLEQGELSDAQDVFDRALAADPGCDAARLALARLALRRGDLAAASEHARRIPHMAAERDIADYIQQAVSMIADAQTIGSEVEVRERSTANTEDFEAWYALGIYLVAAQRYHEALDAFLTVAERNRKWRDEAARKAMLTVFGLLGVRHPLSDAYRRKLMLIY